MVLDYQGCRTLHDFWYFFERGWRECVLFMSKNFLACSRGVGIIFQGLGVLFLNYQECWTHPGFKALFTGCQHGVGKRVSLRGAVFSLIHNLVGFSIAYQPSVTASEL